MSNTPISQELQRSLAAVCDEVVLGRFVNSQCEPLPPTLPIASDAPVSLQEQMGQYRARLAMVDDRFHNIPEIGETHATLSHNGGTRSLSLAAGGLTAIFTARRMYHDAGETPGLTPIDVNHFLIGTEADTDRPLWLQIAAGHWKVLSVPTTNLKNVYSNRQHDRPSRRLPVASLRTDHEISRGNASQMLINLSRFVTLKRN